MALQVDSQIPTKLIEEVAGKINSYPIITDKIKIYSEFYSLLKAGAKLYPGGYDDKYGDKFFCLCSACKTREGYEKVYSVYEALLVSEIQSFQERLESIPIFTKKLEFFNTYFDGDFAHQYETNSGKYELFVRPTTTTDIWEYNKFYYDFYKQRSLENFRLNKILGRNCEDLKSDFINRYSKALRKPQMLEQEIEQVESTFRTLKGRKVASIFKNLCDGHDLYTDQAALSYQEYLDLIPANEGYLYFKFLLEFNSTHSHKKNENASVIMEKPQETDIRVFVTYAWGDTHHETLVERFVATLRQKRYNALIDKMKLEEESALDFRQMMFKQLQISERVIIVLSENYKTKAEKATGGVGIEYNLILKMIDEQPDKFILLSFDGHSDKIVPLGYKDRFVHTLKYAEDWDKLFAKLNGETMVEFPPVSGERPQITKRQVQPMEIPNATVDVTNVMDLDDDKPIVWDAKKAENDIKSAIVEGSIAKVKTIIQANSFLLYDVYDRKMAALPIFHEVPIGRFTIDFVWLDDASSGPVWYLLKISNPTISIMDAEGVPSPSLLNEIEKIAIILYYLNDNRDEVKRIFGAASDFKAILIVGSPGDWEQERAAKWRSNHNKTSRIQIRSYNTFSRSINQFVKDPENFYKFNHFPKTSPKEELEKFWKSYKWMDSWRMLF